MDKNIEFEDQNDKLIDKIDQQAGKANTHTHTYIYRDIQRHIQNLDVHTQVSEPQHEYLTLRVPMAAKNGKMENNYFAFLSL